jgi:aryl-alcohol dehydrogenase-like predicted oxidoreductase
MGTMTFGSQCDESESFAIMDRAFDAGVDFFDAAELYPVPPNKEWAGRTEEIVGKWMKTKPRDAVIVATKVTGPGHGWFSPPIRFGKTMLDRYQIQRALDASLTRLQVETIDLYQTHWPDHGLPYEEPLAALEHAIRAGKIRVAGCSNETCWGVMKSLAASQAKEICRYETVQNNFSLINRRCESELAQVCRREGISLLPYSPLAGGVLTGKYNDSIPKNSRFEEYINADGERQRLMAARFVNDRTLEVARRVGELALEIGTTGTALAVAWSKHQDFVASTIVGATSVEQLNESLMATEVELTPDVLSQLNRIEHEIPLAMTEDGLRYL